MGLEPDRNATVTVLAVDGTEGALAFADEHTSGLAATIVSDDAAAAERFVDGYRGTGVFSNTTTRLLDGYRLSARRRRASTSIMCPALGARSPIATSTCASTSYGVRPEIEVWLDEVDSKAATTDAPPPRLTLRPPRGVVSHPTPVALRRCPRTSAGSPLESPGADQYGPDHGRTPAVPLGPRHAHPAIGCASTYSRMLLETLDARAAGPRLAVTLSSYGGIALRDAHAGDRSRLSSCGTRSSFLLRGLVPDIVLLDLLLPAAQEGLGVLDVW